MEIPAPDNMNYHGFHQSDSVNHFIPIINDPYMILFFDQLHDYISKEV
jgi:hypothetical protein